MNTSSLFKAELRGLYHSALNTKWLAPSLVPSSLSPLRMWFQDSKYDHQCFERPARVAYILLDSESAAEGGVEHWLSSDGLMYGCNC